MKGWDSCIPLLPPRSVLEHAGQGMMLPLGSPLGLSSCLPYKYSFKAVLGLLVLLLVMLGGGIPAAAGGEAGLGVTSQGSPRAGMLLLLVKPVRISPCEYLLSTV